jgi:hypothetical protein
VFHKKDPHKMADGSVNDTNQLPKISSETLNSEGTGCYDCIQLKLELVKVSSELNSTREIIKILQEKESTTQQPREKPRITEQDLDGKPATAEDPYEECTYWTSRK